MVINHSQAVYIPKREHDNPTPNSSKKLEYIYQYFQENEKVHESDPNLATGETDNTLYPHINNI